VSSLGWKQRIVDLVAVKQQLADLDARGLWQYCLPHVAATEASLVEVGRQIGEPLDASYREFLMHADGWPAFYQTVDLFGSDDLLGGPKFEHATEMMSYVESEVLAAGGLQRDELLPIAASPVDLDLFVMTRRSAVEPGVVIWLAGSEVDRFPTFEEYYLAMVDYNRLEVRRLSGSR